MTELDNLDTPTRVRKQKRFLAVYRECGNIKYSCKKASIPRSTFYVWKEHDADFRQELETAQLEAFDTLEQAAYERAVLGVEEPVVSQGQLVYDYVPLLDKDGEQKFDNNGKPLYQRGKQIIKRVYSDSLLTTLLKANLPAKYKDKQQVDMNVKDLNASEIQALQHAISEALVNYPDAKIALAEKLATMEVMRESAQ